MREQSEWGMFCRISSSLLGESRSTLVAMMTNADEDIRVFGIAATTYGLPFLNFDVLFVVMEALDPVDVSRMMRTCWTLYRSGARHILGAQRGVHIHRHDRVLPFYHFMLAEKGARFKFLRKLVLSSPDLCETKAEALIVILKRTTHLEVLELRGVENTLNSATNLPDAVASLTSIRSMNLSEACMTTCNMLHSIQTPLKTLRLSYVEFVDGPFADVPFFYQFDTHQERAAYHPLSVCAKLAPTLESLHLSFTHADLPQLPDPLSAPAYPHLHMLVLQEDWPLIGPYIAATPNLTRLVLASATNGEPGDVYDEEPTIVSDCRGVNRRAQLADGSWNNLREVCGSPVEVYICGLVCRVPKLSLFGILESHLDILPDIVNDMQPEELDLGVHADLFKSADNSIPELLLHAGCAEVKRLTVTITVGRKDNGMNLDNTMVCSSPQAFLDALLLTRCGTDINRFSFECTSSSRVSASHNPVEQFPHPKESSALHDREHTLSRCD